LTSILHPRILGWHKGGHVIKSTIVVLALLCCAMAQDAPKSKSQGKSPAAAQAASHKTAFTPDEVQYGPAPPFLSPGAQAAVLEGDPNAASGTYTIRLKLPDGYKIAPHWHPKREHVTVISGSFKVGMGDTFDESKMMSFPAGSFAYLDPRVHHYAMSNGETVVQVHGIAPVKFIYVNPNDDPRKKAQ
jgi:mannose-6-phosphate isomerase-like protein (cupin superfamily)